MDKDALGYAVQHAPPNHKGWVRTNCPACEERTGKADRKRSLGYQLRTGYYHCFRCGVKGWLRGVSTDYDTAQFDDADEPVVALDPPDGFYPLAEDPGLSSCACAPMRQYLAGRGVGLMRARQAGIGGCVRGKFKGRVVVPVLADDGAWLWYVGRSIHKNVERKYLYPAGSRDGLVYNHAALLVETDEPVIVVEGVFDALPYWPDGVAMLGKPTEAHIVALVAARRPVCVVLDGDAWEEGMSLAFRLRLEGQRAGALQLPPQVDPDEVDVGELRCAARASIEA